MLTVNLGPVFKARGIENPYYFLVKEGFTASTANKIIKGESTVLRMEHIEKLCASLYCTPNELFLYTPGKKNKLSPSHPLNNLTGQLEDFKLKEIIQTIPLNQLKQIADAINAGKTEK
ncbi:MAG TPA: helix-turn-helix transcriptional regulator [Chitinophagaceae bacterium]|nr:helix-turn-helix transcriptional regulator [Chitinophagaceae bacterium]